MQDVSVVNDHVHGVLPHVRLHHHGPKPLKIAILKNDHQPAVRESVHPLTRLVADFAATIGCACSWLVASKIAMTVLIGCFGPGRGRVPGLRWLSSPGANACRCGRRSEGYCDRR